MRLEAAIAADAIAAVRGLDDLYSNTKLAASGAPSR
jgi:hypothetical protein